MARTNLAIVHPASTSRIEAASLELAEVRARIKELENQKIQLSARLLKMVEREGEADDEGKIRYETDAHKFVIIETQSRYVHEKPLKKALLALGLTPKQQAKVLAVCVTTSDTKYVGMYAKTDEVNVGKEAK